MDTLVDIAKAVVIAVLLGLVMLLLGILGAGVLCSAEGSCQIAHGLAEALGGDGKPFSINGTALELIALLLATGLAISLVPKPPVRWLAGVFMVLLVADGALMALKPAVPASVEPAPESVDVPDPVQETLSPAPLVQLPACEAGTFRAEGSTDPCIPCSREVTVAAPATVSLVPLRTGAHWVYASDALVSAGEGDISVGAFMTSLGETTGLCDAPALLVFGSASSDGPPERNRRRSRSRADKLASAVAETCGSNVQTFAISLGQSQHDSDDEADRPVAITQVFPLSDDPLTARAILDELGYALAEQGASFPLLARRDRFPDPWVSPDGEDTRLDALPRPQVMEVVPAPGAPTSCAVPGAAGLDETAMLLQ
ncbi:MAG: hypothetical protein HRU11_09950 [Parvularculaceae bacterium]|nr:hypothetical protein [Parvularculaceae bacterium]